MSNDVGMHTVRRQIAFTGPGDSAHFEARFGKQARIQQIGENATEEIRTEAHVALYAVNKSDMHPAVACQLHIDHAPRRLAFKWGHHGSGAIFTGRAPVLASAQAAISSL